MARFLVTLESKKGPTECTVISITENVTENDYYKMNGKSLTNINNPNHSVHGINHGTLLCRSAVRSPPRTGAGAGTGRYSCTVDCTVFPGFTSACSVHDQPSCGPIED